MAEIFKASVQYNDFLGSVAADRADVGDARSWLQQNNHMQVGEFMLGMDAYVSIPGRSAGSEVIVNVTFMLIHAKDFDSARALLRSGKPTTVRKVSVELPAKDFFSLFKRFNLTLSSSGEFEGHEYEAGA